MHDVIIVGGGPAGLSAALLLARCRRRVVVVDAGEPRNAAARELHGFLSRDGTRPQELLQLGRAELARYAVEMIDDLVIGAECLTPATDTTATTGDHDDDSAGPSCFRLQTRGGRTLQGRKLLLATGTRDRLPPLQGLRECYGISAHHCPYCDAWEHRDEHLLAYGDEPDDAVGLGLLLTGWSQHVTVLTHGKALAAEDRRRALRGKLAINEEPIVRLLHTEGLLHSVQLRHGSPLPARALFFNTTQWPQSDLPQLLGCEMENSFATHTGRRQTTKVPGLFMAGDAGGEVQFAIVAASEGAIAAVAINHQLLKEDDR